MTIEIRNIAKSYGAGESRTEVLKDINLTVDGGSFTAILGASGSGKSTLLNVVSGLERPDGGSVLYDGRDICALTDKQLTAFRKDKIGFIFQQYYLLPNMTDR